jgi:hypothetical protein
VVEDAGGDVGVGEEGEDAEGGTAAWAGGDVGAEHALEQGGEGIVQQGAVGRVAALDAPPPPVARFD